MAVIFNILTDSPTLVYPNGGETFIGGSINIQWTEPDGIQSKELVWYEIFITDKFGKNEKPELLQIATIPSGNTSYTYTIQKNLKGTESKIGIRAVNHEGLRSKISFSADNFIISNKKLPTPSVMEPITGNSYFSYIPFIFDHSSIIGRCSQRSFYQIYYKSDNQGIDWSLFQSNIMVGSDPISIDVSNFNTDSDYMFKIELVSGEDVSESAFINNININNINLFLIDTTPPKGSIKIIDNEEYTKEAALLVSLEASDKTSDIKDVQIQQTDVGSGEVVNGIFVDMTSLLTWDIKSIDGGDPTDGVKLIQARYRDFGNNIIEDLGISNYFRTYKNLDDRNVTVFLYDGTDLYSAFDEDISTETTFQLYKNLTLLSALDGECSSLKFYNNILYISIKDDENKGILQRFTGGAVNTVADNESQYLDSAQTTLNSLYYADSVINAMEVFDNTLFLGLENGELLSFSGSTIMVENDDYFNIRSINNLKTDGNLLYILFDNTTEILVMSTDADSDYTFETIDTES